MPMTSTRIGRIRLLVLLMAIVLAGVAWLKVPAAQGADTMVVNADFTDTTGIYVGNEVQYLGVPIGHVTGITPHGTVMTVRMAVDAKTPLPRDAGAEILQSALLTDRFVQLGPAYRGGPRLGSGAHIAVEHTRSPISIDDVGKAIDALVRALDQTGPGGKDIGDLLHATARTFDGNGAQVRQLLVSSRAALAAINDKAPDLVAIVSNLSVLARTLGVRDAMIRRFTANLETSSAVVAQQSASLGQTLRSLSELTDSVAAFVRQNKSKLTSNLRDAGAVAESIHRQQDSLSEIFDLMPTGAENIARAFDSKRGALRVAMALRDMLVFSDLVRSQFCGDYLGSACLFLLNPQGTGALDLVLDRLRDAFPGSLG
jgi:phospholipid/cholesterol/gamma-HCH transport system substrate-binding protein